MLEILVTFFILIVLMLSPFWMYYRMTVSKETRSHLNALLLHDIIKITLKALGRFIAAVFHVIAKIFALAIAGLKRILP